MSSGPPNPFAGWSFVRILCVLILVAACVAIACVALNAIGIGIPPWVIMILWIIGIAFVAIMAIKLLASWL